MTGQVAQPVPLKVVVDSSVLWADFLMSGASFRVLRDGVDRGLVALFIPDVVIDEVKNKFREELNAERIKAETNARRLEHLLGVEKMPPLITADQMELATRKYVTHLDANLLRYGATRVPYPGISHEEVVRRELQRTKPFSEKGTGYRDFLIWESICSLAVDGPIAFVCNNARDFLASDDSLHADLIRDLTHRGLQTGHVKPFKTMRSFVEKYVTPKLSELLDAEQKVDVQKIKRWLLASGLAILQEESWEGVFVGLDSNSTEIIHPIEILEVEFIDLVEVRLLSDNEQVVDFLSKILCEFMLVSRNAPLPASQLQMAERTSYVTLSAGVGFRVIMDRSTQGITQADVSAFFPVEQ